MSRCCATNDVISVDFPNEFDLSGVPIITLTKSRFTMDRSIAGVIQFLAGMASFTCSTRLASFQRVSVFGTRGRLELELPFNPPTDRPHRALLEANGGSEHIDFDVCDQYGIQADRFSRAILDDTEVLTPIHDAVANMRVIDALARSSNLGTCQRPG